jgi:hypothetical protein
MWIEPSLAGDPMQSHFALLSTLFVFAVGAFTHPT